MQQSMMVPAKQQQIIHAGLTPVAPVLYMVCIDKARLTATWKTAAPVTQAQCPANSRRDGTGLAPDIEHITRPILHDTDQTGITGEAPRRCRGERRQKLTIFDLTDSLVVVCGEIGIEMHHDLVFIASRERTESIAQCSKRLFGQGQQRIGAFLGKACSRLVFQKRSRGNVFCC